MINNYSVYILRLGDGSLYTGVTNNIENRLKVHSEGKGSKYVQTRLHYGMPKLVYTSAGMSKSTAYKLEAQIKAMTKKRKEKLVRMYQFSNYKEEPQDKVECPYCNIVTESKIGDKVISTPESTFIIKIRYNECPKCNFRSIAGTEYERIRKLTNK
jgi:putative endonuclease